MSQRILFAVCLVFTFCGDGDDPEKADTVPEKQKDGAAYSRYRSEMAPQ